MKANIKLMHRPAPGAKVSELQSGKLAWYLKYFKVHHNCSGSDQIWTYGRLIYAIIYTRMRFKGAGTVSLQKVVDLQNHKTSMADIAGMAQKSHKTTAQITLVVHITIVMSLQRLP